MGPRPWKPAAELDGALERGELSFAIALAAEVSADQRRPIDLELALRFLPVVSTEQREHYDAWALRWLARWIAETDGATIDRAAEIAGALAELPMEPSACLEAIRRV
jgi:hypothetical protein